MAIAEMSRLTLVAMKSDKDKILETLQRTGAVQITESVETEMPENKDELSSAAGLNADIARAQSALDVIAREMDNVPKKTARRRRGKRRHRRDGGRIFRRRKTSR